MKLHGFFKTQIFLIIIISFVILFGCDKSKIYMKYHFFSTSELEDVCMNVDSIMKFQSKISKIETFDEFDGAEETEGFSAMMEVFDLQKAIDMIAERMRKLDRTIQSTEPFKKIKIEPEEAKRDVHAMLVEAGFDSGKILVDLVAIPDEDCWGGSSIDEDSAQP